MLKVRLAVATLGISMILALIPALQAQTPVAPLPSQILTAKKVFISNARGEWNPYHWSGTPERTYNEFYAAIKNWGRFEIVSAPSDSDLVLQIGFTETIAMYGIGQVNNPQFKLLILDPKTNIQLWILDEHVELDRKIEKNDRNFEVGINNLLGYLKALTAQPAPTSSTK